MKPLKNLIVVLGFACVAVVAARNIIIKNVAVLALKKTTGLDMRIEQFHLGLFTPTVSIRGVTIGNPEGFTDATMVSLPELSMQYDLGAILQQKARITRLTIELKELTMVRDNKGGLNLSVFESLVPKKTGDQKAPEVRIDLLELKIGKVIYKDYTAGSRPAVSEYQLNINERIMNVTDMQSLTQYVLSKALSGAGLAALSGLDLSGVANQLDEASLEAEAAAQEVQKQADSAKKELQQKATEAVQDTVKQLQGLFPAGEEKK